MMNKEDLYYIYRIQYENLLTYLDRYTIDLDKRKVSKAKIIEELSKIGRVSCDNTELLKYDFKRGYHFNTEGPGDK